MAISYERKYGFLYSKGQETSLQSKLDAYKLIRNPVAYVTNKYAYELIMDGIIKEDFTKFAEYDVFWELVMKLWKDPSFIANKTYKNYGADEVEVDPDFIGFTWDSKEWRIYLTYNRLATEYPINKKYFVFFDDNDTIERDELYPALMNIITNIGKENPYDNMKRYEYQDPNKNRLFYVFYYGAEPSVDKCRSVIREELIRKFGYENAKQSYPNLFIDTFRKIYTVSDNKGYPINYTQLQEFIVKHDIFRPEVVLLLDWTVPIVIENGLSDVLPKFTPITEKDADSNKFIYFLSRVLNYLQGKLLTPDFVKEAQFSETTTYAAFVFGGIEWQVMKINYNKNLY